ncbi:MAG: hypothetical protein ACOZNI_13285 [Myxococcota bacterium]
MPLDVSADPFVQVDLEGSHACGVRRSGAVACFDDADPVLRAVPALAGAARVAVSPGGFACAVLRDGKVRCADLDPHTRWPLVRTAPAVADAVSVFFAEQEICVLRREGATTCFEAYGDAPPRADAWPRGLRDVATGEHHVSAVLADGSVHGWGSNGRGQLGPDAPVGHAEADDVVPAGPAGGARAPVRNATAVAAGSEHTCAIHDGGKVTCWGTHYEGALGVGDAEPEPGQPVRVPGLADAVEIEASAWTTCVRHRDGAVSCWGANGAGQVGDGALTHRTSPVRVRPPGSAVDLALDETRACAALADGTISCWGAWDRTRPARVAGLADVVALTAGEEGTCAQRRDGAVFCWGRLGALRGDGFVSLAVPTRVPELDGLRELGLVTEEWDWRACGIGPDGARCAMAPPSAGGDVYELAAVPRRLYPLPFEAPRHLALHGGRGWVVDGDGAVSCFWSDPYAEAPISSIPVPGLSDVARVAPMSFGACAVTTGGEVACLGRRSESWAVAEELGGRAVRVQGVDDVVALSGPDYRTFCAVERSGRVACWAYDEEAQAVTFTRAIEGIADAVDVAVGGPRPCAVTRRGAVLCFDEPRADGEMAPPEPVAGVTDAVRIVEGDEHTCVLHRDGSVSCWGQNRYGQLGDGRGAGRAWTVPVAAP